MRSYQSSEPQPILSIHFWKTWHRIVNWQYEIWIHEKIIVSIFKKSCEIQTCNDHMFETGTYSWGAITRIFFLPIVLGLSPNLCAFSIFVRTFWSKNQFIADEKYFLRSNNFTKRVSKIIIDNNIIAEESFCF